jgi:hypothetical protein
MQQLPDVAKTAMKNHEEYKMKKTKTTITWRFLFLFDK